MADLFVGALKLGVAAKKTYDDSPVSDIVDIAGAAARANKARQQDAPQAAQQPMQQAMQQPYSPHYGQPSYPPQLPSPHSYPPSQPFYPPPRQPMQQQWMQPVSPHNMAQVVPANPSLYPIQPMQTTFVVQGCQHQWDTEYTCSGRFCCLMLLPLSLLNCILCCGKTACSHQRCKQCRLGK